MRFEGERRSGWLGMAAVALVLLAWIGPELGDPSGDASLKLGAVFLAATAAVCVWEFASSRLLNYAELGETELKVVRGLRMRRVSYRSIVGINRKRTDLELRSSSIRIMGVAVEASGEKLFVRVQDERGFVDELKRRCPQAELDTEPRWVS